MKSPGFLLSIAILGLTFVGFQNCSNTHFKPDPVNVGLKTEDSAGGTSSEVVPLALPDEESGDETMTGIDPTVPNAVPGVPETSEVVSLPVEDEGGKSHGNPNGNGRENAGANVNAGPNAGNEDGSGLVECDLGRPNSKVVLSQILQPGSNAQSTRLCMSENACLKLVNSYASVRDCTLAEGAAPASASNGSQCTAIFPGSRGTCKNAQILTDVQITDLLVKMAAPK